MEKRCVNCDLNQNGCDDVLGERCLGMDSIKPFQYNYWQPKEPKEETMKYEIIEAISAKTLLDKVPCSEGYADYINKFGIGELVHGDFAPFITWAEENGHISWLIDNGFIKEVKPELKPCPFCGGEKLRHLTSWGNPVVVCKSCHVEGPVADTKKFANKAWNKRCR